jgi:hypothetical protein
MTILGRPTTRLGMVLPRGDTIRSSTSDAMLAGTDSEIGHSQSTRNSAGSNTRESRTTAR